MNDKYMLQLLSSISDKQWFFAIWVVIVGAFVLMMIRHYQRQTRRNFKEEKRKLDR